MNLSQALAQRRSTRAFLERAVEPALLRALLQQAARAPSGGNLQPWRVEVLMGDALVRFRQRIRVRRESSTEPDEPPYAVYPQPIFEPYRSHRYQVGEDMYALLGVAREDRPARLAWFARNYAFFGAPCALFFFVDRRMGPGQWADLGMFEQSLMLLLEAAGLASCPQACWTHYHREVADFLAIPEEWVLHAGLAVGYADPSAPVNALVSRRMAVEDFCRFHGG